MVGSNQNEKHCVISTLIWKAATPIEPGNILRATSRTVGSRQGETHR